MRCFALTVLQCFAPARTLRLFKRVMQCQMLHPAFLCCRTDAAPQYPTALENAELATMRPTTGSNWNRGCAGLWWRRRRMFTCNIPHAKWGEAQENGNSKASLPHQNVAGSHAPQVLVSGPRLMHEIGCSSATQYCGLSIPWLQHEGTIMELWTRRLAGSILPDTT